MILTNEALISGIMDFLLIFIFSLMGAIVKDVYNTETKVETDVKVSRILLSTIVSSVIIFGLSDWMIGRMTWKTFALVSFIGGLIGFDSLSKLTNLNFWINLYNLTKAANQKTIEDEEKEKHDSSEEK